MRTFYQVLGVAEQAPAEDIKRAYRRLVRQLHPDMTGGEGAPLRRVIEAYETLSDERKRRDYDEGLARQRRLPRPVSDHRAWFRDEIDIDFPSIGGLVDRMRESFLGRPDPRPSLSAEILLSRREAFDGVRVPLEVPVPSTCPLCGGRGESWMESCRGCDGTGAWHVPHYVELSVPAGVADGTRFRFTVAAPHTTPTEVEIRVAVR